MSTPKNKNNNQLIEMKKKLKELEDKIIKVEKKNVSLEGRIEQLESVNAVMSKVNDELTRELDRLDQYSRRSNVIVKNVFLPEEETQEQLEHKIHKIIKKDLKMESAVNDIDKLHRTGKVKSSNGKKLQNVIIRFKTHASRYAVFKEKKKLKNVKICPNLTRRRGKLWYDASQFIQQIPEIDFAYADIHGDLKFRLVEEHQGKIVFPFDSLDGLKEIIKELGFHLIE